MLSKRVGRLEAPQARHGSFYPKWEALALLLDYSEGPHAARLYRAGKTKELKDLFLYLEADRKEYEPWRYRAVDQKQLTWAVEYVGNNLAWIETWKDGTHENNQDPN